MWKASSPSCSCALGSSQLSLHGIALPSQASSVVFCKALWVTKNTVFHLDFGNQYTWVTTIAMARYLCFFLFNSWKWYEGFWAQRLSFIGVADFILICSALLSIHPHFQFQLAPQRNTANVILLPCIFLVFYIKILKRRSHVRDVPDYTKHHFLSRPKVKEVTPHPSRTIASYLHSEVEVQPSITTTLSNRPIHKPSTLPSVDVIDLVENRRRWHMWI